MIVDCFLTTRGRRDRDVAISWFRLDRFDLDVFPTRRPERDVAVSSRFCLMTLRTTAGSTEKRERNLRCAPAREEV